jgi:hypothetical protein
LGAKQKKQTLQQQQTTTTTTTTKTTTKYKTKTSKGPEQNRPHVSEVR